MKKKAKVLNLNRAKKVLKAAIDEFNDDLDFVYAIKDDCLSATATFTLTALDKEVDAAFFVYENGLAIFTFGFGALERTQKVLKLLEAFNESLSYFRASLDDENDELGLLYATPYITEDSLGELTGWLLDDIVDDNTMEVLKPLTDLTTTD